MASSTKKKWTVITNRNTKVTVEAERASLDEAHARVTFYDGEETVASFVGFAGYFPATAEVSE